FPMFEERFEDSGIVPVEFPPLLNGNQRVASGKNLVEAEGAVAVALIASEERRLVFELLRDQYDHGFRGGLVVAQHGAVDTTLTLGHGEGELDGTVMRQGDGVSAHGSASG